MFLKSRREKGNGDKARGRELFEPDILALTLHGRRDVGSTGHAHARDHILTRMTEVGLKPFRGDSFILPYKYGGTSFYNLAGIVPGDGSGKKAGPLLLGAHYDTCGPYPGADDNASSVAISLYILEQLVESPLNRDLIMVFFDAEEPPYFFTEAMGSIRFYRDQLTGTGGDTPVDTALSPVEFALILDLIGHDVPVPGIEDLLFLTGMESHSTLGGVLEGMEVDGRIRIVPVCNKYVGDMSDHYIFRISNVPYLFVSCGRWPAYHTPKDTPDKLNYGKMLAIADFLRTLLVEVDGQKFPHEDAGYDTTPLELDFMNAAVGSLLTSIGLPPPRTRMEMERIIFTLMHKFGI